MLKIGSIMLILLLSCIVQKKDPPRVWDITIFKNTHVYELVKLIESNEMVKLNEELSEISPTSLNEREPYYGNTLLQWCILNYKYEAFVLLLKHDADISIKSNDSTSAVISCAWRSEVRYLEEILKYNPDVNTIADVNGPQHHRTPLIAACGAHLDNVKLLINAGADPELKCTINGFQSPLQSALTFDRLDIVLYLIKEVKVDFKNALGTTYSGEPLYITDHLRGMAYNLDSPSHRMKMEIVEFIEANGMDYHNTKIPDWIQKKFDQEYLDKY